MITVIILTENTKSRIKAKNSWQGTLMEGDVVNYTKKKWLFSTGVIASDSRERGLQMPSVLGQSLSDTDCRVGKASSQ